MKVVDTEAAAGGGSLPGLTRIRCLSASALKVADTDAVQVRLREQGVVARVDDGMLVCDLRTIDPDDDARVMEALACHARSATAGHVDHGKRHSCSL